MELGRGVSGVLLAGILWVLLAIGWCFDAQSDIDCLKSIKTSVEDPNNYSTYSWNFDNNMAGFICHFTGVDCWHEGENRVLNLKLSNMGLKGQFPHSVQNCPIMTGLDLSSNDFSGSIPTDISRLIQFLTTLDLSSNRFSGEIPVSLANCSFLNSIKLDDNQLSGLILAQLSQLGRLTSFSVASNQLVGTVPNFGHNMLITAENYANNLGLCGSPLPQCKSSNGSRPTLIAAPAVGRVTFAAICVGIGIFFLLRRRSYKEEDDPEGNKWAKSLIGSKGVKVSVFEKSA